MIPGSTTYTSMTSPDGITWTYHAPPGGVAYVWVDVLWDGTKFVAFSSAGDVATSTNGDTWTIVSNMGVSVMNAAWNGTLYVTLNNSTTAYISTNLTTWSPVSLPTGSSWRYITTLGNYFVMIDTTSARKSAKTLFIAPTITFGSSYKFSNTVPAAAFQWAVECVMSDGTPYCTYF